jgi:hypothetical protein
MQRRQQLLARARVRARLAGEQAERTAQPPATVGAWPRRGGRRQGHMVPSIREARTCPPARRRSLVPSLSSSFAARVPRSDERRRGERRRGTTLRE